MLLLLLACAPSPEPLDLPADPAAQGAPVGVRTLAAGEQTLEVFYPASDATIGEAGEDFDLSGYVPAAVAERLGGVSLPLVSSVAVRDAELRLPEAPYPVVFFSHGFGGMRVQSIDYASHLASRGYVVVSADHPGRMLGDVLPCIFSPALDGCDLAGSFLEDPAVEDLEDALAWLDAAAVDPEGFLYEAVDAETLGLTGHSAGGGSALSYGQEEPRFDALLPMAAIGAVEREVPSLVMTGACDYLFVSGEVDDAGTPDDPDDDAVSLSDTPWEAAQRAAEASAVGQALSIHGAGHLAFSDLCDLDLGGLAERELASRDDINQTLYGQLIALATDGCPSREPSTLVAAVPGCEAGWLEMDRAHEIIRGAATGFFDLHLRGEGEGPSVEAYPEADLSAAR